MRQLASVVVTPSFEPLPTKSFKEKEFPTGVRFLYLRSKENQNKVVTIGYWYVTPDEVEWQDAAVNVDVGDSFEKEVGRRIVLGRIKSYGPKAYMFVKNKDDMYTRFIAAYHPDRSERKKYRQKLGDLK